MQRVAPPSACVRSSSSFKVTVFPMKRSIQISMAGAAASLALFAAQAAADQVMVNPNRASGGPLDLPDSHTVVQGDTLFDLSMLYLEDAYLWPRLWSYNPQVTNPHWIYPGDILFLRPEVVATAAEVASKQAVAKFQKNVGKFYPMAGFWTGSELQELGKIKYARTGRELLQPEDEVYLEFVDPDQVVVGQEYAINRVVNRVIDDATEELIAVEYEVIGRIAVRQRHDDTELVSGVISQLWNVIRRGDILFVNQPQLLLVEPKANTVDYEAEIIGTSSNRAILHEQDYIFVNAGWDDGIRPGNRLAIWDRQDEAAQIQASLDGNVDYETVRDELPWQRYGEAMVVYATATYATAVIRSAGANEIGAGMRVTFRNGY
jgi:hypothetical protein